MSIHSRIRELRERKGWSMERLADEISKAEGLAKPLAWQTVQQWESGSTAPKRSRLATVAQLLGTSVNKLIDDGEAHHVAEEAAVAYGLQPILAWEHPDDLPPGEYVLIPRLDLHLSAGNGKDQVVIDFLDKQPQAFRADWVRSERLKPSKLACMTAHGNSMEPNIWDGDSLVIDTSQRDVVDGKVYALWYEGGERVKRLSRLPGGGLRIKSDNPQHDTIDLGPDYLGHVRIIGRVVHRSGKGGL